MDTLENAALAPLNFIIRIGCGVLEGSSHEEALHLHGEEGLEDAGWIEVETSSEGGGGGGAQNL